MSKKLLIAGVGRSGTTAIYSLLQDIMESQYPKDIDYVYEPFLWDRQALNKLYKDIDPEWRYCSTLSVDAAFYNKKIPLLCGPSMLDVGDGEREFIRRMFTPEGKTHLLCKAIRINGRLPLVKHLDSDVKLIFMMRNPVDVINSSVEMFSFFGGDFYSSDYSRFIEEVKGIYGQDILVRLGFKSDTYVQKEFLYWYFMNRFSVDYLRESGVDFLFLSYEEYVSNRVESIKKICKYVGITYDESFVESSKSVVGPVFSAASNLKKEEFTYLDSCSGCYEEFLASMGGQSSAVYLKTLPKKYAEKGFSTGRNYDYAGCQSLYLRNIVRKREVALRKLEEEVAVAEVELAEAAVELVGAELECRGLGKRCESLEREKVDFEKMYTGLFFLVDALVNTSFFLSPIKKWNIYKQLSLKVADVKLTVRGGG